MRLIGLAVALAFSVFVAPLLFELAAGEAQQTGKVFRIGVLSPVPLEQLAASIPEGVANQRMVQDRAGRFSADDPGRCADYRYGGHPWAFCQFGYVEGRNITIEARWGAPDRLSEVATELVRLKVDVIHAIGPVGR